MALYLGLDISSEQHWEDYLQKYGTGHFDRTFLICNANEGINEMELYFLRHLIHNKRLQQIIKMKITESLFRNVTLVVSNTDSLMAPEQMDLMQGRMAEESFNRRFATHRQDFQDNLENKVREKLKPRTDLSKLGNRSTLLRIN